MLFCELLGLPPAPLPGPATLKPAAPAKATVAPKPVPAIKPAAVPTFAHLAARPVPRAAAGPAHAPPVERAPDNVARGVVEAMGLLGPRRIGSGADDRR